MTIEAGGISAVPYAAYGRLNRNGIHISAVDLPHRHVLVDVLVPTAKKSVLEQVVLKILGILYRRGIISREGFVCLFY